MKTSILTLALVAVTLVVPAVRHHASPFTGVTVSAHELAQSADPAPPPSQPAAQPSSGSSSQSAPAAQSSASSQPAPQVNVDVRNTGWHPNPTWVAIGAIGAVLLVVIVVMASRSGSNTVIRG